MKKLTFLIIVICLAVLACSDSKDSPQEKVSSVPPSSNEVVQEESEVDERTEEVSEVVVVEEEESPPPVIEEVALDVIDGFIDDKAWDFLEQGFDLIRSVDSSETFESLQEKLNQSAALMSQAKPAFSTAKNTEGLEGYAYYPLAIIEIYEKTAVAYGSSGGDPTTLSALTEADELFENLISLVEEGSHE